MDNAAMEFEGMWTTRLVQRDKRWIDVIVRISYDTRQVRVYHVSEGERDRVGSLITSGTLPDTIASRSDVQEGVEFPLGGSGLVQLTSVCGDASSSRSLAGSALGCGFESGPVCRAPGFRRPLVRSTTCSTSGKRPGDEEGDEEEEEEEERLIPPRKRRKDSVHSNSWNSELESQRIETKRREEDSERVMEASREKRSVLDLLSILDQNENALADSSRIQLRLSQDPEDDGFKIMDSIAEEELDALFPDYSSLLDTKSSYESQQNSVSHAESRSLTSKPTSTSIPVEVGDCTGEFFSRPSRLSPLRNTLSRPIENGGKTHKVTAFIDPLDLITAELRSKESESDTPVSERIQAPPKSENITHLDDVYLNDIYPFVVAPKIPTSHRASNSISSSLSLSKFFRKLDFPVPDGQGKFALSGNGVRQTFIPNRFQSVEEYKTIWMDCLMEHISLQVRQLSFSLFENWMKIRLSVSSSLNHSNSTSSDRSGTTCKHGDAILAFSKSPKNQGRPYWRCVARGSDNCGFLGWVDAGVSTCTDSTSSINSGNSSVYLSYEDIVRPHSAIEKSLRASGVPFYLNVGVEEKDPAPFTRPKGGKQIERNKKKRDSTSLFLELSNPEFYSKYSKDDLWILLCPVARSASLFDTYLLRSAFFSLNSDNLLEVVNMDGSPAVSLARELHSQQCFALRGPNLANEIAMLDSLIELNEDRCPLLPVLLYGKESSLHGCTRATDPLSTTFAEPLQAVQSIPEIESLNEEQRNVIHNCISEWTRSDAAPESSVCLVRGAFGSGKTRLLVSLILALLRILDPSEKILVCSLTNVAVDNILEGLLACGCEDFVRVGSLRRISRRLYPRTLVSLTSDSSREQIRHLRNLVKEESDPDEKKILLDAMNRLKTETAEERVALLDEARVVGITCAALQLPAMNSASSSCNSNFPSNILSNQNKPSVDVSGGRRQFAVLLFDEATQTVEPLHLVPLCCGVRKMLAIGDPCQLSPVIEGASLSSDFMHPGDSFDKPLYVRLQRIGVPTFFLRKQYRCHPQLSSLSNSLFYENSLMDGITAEDREAISWNSIVPPLVYIDSSGSSEELVHGSKVNRAEASAVAQIVRLLRSEGVADSDIGIIALYKQQINVILDAMGSSYHKNLAISTVDAFQGAEKEVIIISCSRTESLGFVDDDRRTNVALTRARRHLFVVGSSLTLKTSRIWRRFLAHVMSSQARKLGFSMVLRDLMSLATFSDVFPSHSDAELSALPSC